MGQFARCSNRVTVCCGGRRDHPRSRLTCLISFLGAVFVLEWWWSNLRDVAKSNIHSPVTGRDICGYGTAIELWRDRLAPDCWWALPYRQLIAS